MTSDEWKSTRRWWRPRFSLRTFTIVVTLVCAYFGAWEVTMRWGGASIGDRSATSLVPFIVMQDRFGAGGEQKIAYYLWFFGLVVELTDNAGKRG